MSELLPGRLPIRQRRQRRSTHKGIAAFDKGNCPAPSPAARAGAVPAAVRVNVD
jgi:hypothetical protein